jgi:hypothetical protein
VAVHGAGTIGAVNFIIYLELWGGGGHMGVIFTNSNAVSNKLCLFYVHLQKFKSPQIREQADWKKEQKNSS